jgi:hypothetical protein
LFVPQGGYEPAIVRWPIDVDRMSSPGSSDS